MKSNPSVNWQVARQMRREGRSALVLPRLQEGFCTFLLVLTLNYTLNLMGLRLPLVGCRQKDMARAPLSTPHFDLGTISI